MATREWVDVEEGEDLVGLEELEGGDISCLDIRYFWGVNGTRNGKYYP
jgi:hypothetical protein